jgi:hypothetical protein
MSVIPPLLQIAAGRRPRLRKAARCRPKEITLHLCGRDGLARSRHSGVALDPLSGG